MNNDDLSNQMERIEKFLRPQQLLQEQIEAALRPHRLMQEQMQAALRPHQLMQEQIEAALRSHRIMQEQIEAALQPHRLMQEQMEAALGSQHYFQDILKTIRDIDLQNISFAPDGTVTVDGSILSKEEISEKLKSLCAGLKPSTSLVDTLSTIVTYVKALGHPFDKLIVVMLLPYLISIIANLTTPYFEGLLPKSNKEQIKAIKNNANKEFPQGVLKEYRFVGITKLKVRSGPSTSQKIVDEIKFGHVIHLLRKGRKWSLIEYTDELTEEKVIGYVFSRYLAKFQL